MRLRISRSSDIELGDGMMNMNVRVLVVAAICVVLGSMNPSSAAASLPTLHGLTAEAGSSGPVIHLRTDHALETVHYSPQPGVWVIEMPEVDWERSTGTLVEPSIGIERAELSEVDEFGKRVTRLTVWLDEPSQLRLDTTSGGLDLVFTSFAAGTDPEPRPEPVVAVVAPIEPAPPSGPASGALLGEAANLLEVVAIADENGAVIELKGDGVLSGTTFMLPNPDRLVIDLKGVIKRFNRSIYPVGSGPVRQVRVAQNRTVPEPVTRIVVDLEGEARYVFTETPNGAVIRVADAGAPMADPVPAVITESEIVNETEYVVARNEIEPHLSVQVVEA